MSSRTTLWLLVAAVALAVIIWTAEQKGRAVRQLKTQTARAWAFAAEDVSELVVQSGEFRFECVRKDGAWFLRGPLQSRADTDAIERILSLLEALPRREVITAEQRADRTLKLADYGLRPPRARFIVTAQGLRRELQIGRDAPLGNSVYVKASDDDAVIATTRDVVGIIPASVRQVRDLAVFHGDAGRTTRIEIRRHGGGLIQLARLAGTWMLQQPVFDRADQARVAKLLDALYRLKVQEFVWDPLPESGGSGGDAEASARAEQYGLVPDTAAARIQLWSGAEPVGSELVVGKPAGESGATLYARLTDNPSIFTVPSNIVADLSMRVNDVRDRNVFSIDPERVRSVRLQDGDRKLMLARDAAGLWRVTEPVQWAADRETVQNIVAMISHLQVEEFDAETATNLSAFGLAPPRYRIQLAETAPAASEERKGQPLADKAKTEEPAPPLREVLLVASPAPEATNVYACFEGGAVFYIQAATIRALGEDAADPLLYRDRTILAVSADSVARITLLKDGREQSVMRSESDAWSCAPPDTNGVSQAEVQDVLLLCANLRALRIETQNPKNLAAYGLDRSGVVLTLGLRRDAGIQKTVMLGFKVRAYGRFAMVQGDDIVFVIANDVAERLSRSLLKSSGAGGEPAAAEKGESKPQP